VAQLAPVWVAQHGSAYPQFNEEEILNNKGKISRAVAAELAIKEYEKYRIKQDNKYLSDFDIALKEIKKK